MTERKIVTRVLQPSDAPAVAALHAASWRSAYRNILSDAFLDGALDAHRLAWWTPKLAALPVSEAGFLALDGSAPVGFAFVTAGADARWGTLLDNLHVHPDCKGRGVGRALLCDVGAWCIRQATHRGLYLWVWEENHAARAVYEHLGGRAEDAEAVTAPDGHVVVHRRYVWDDVQTLLKQCTP
jgi:GNAT superfamily N-acetyltransferase